MSKYEKVNKNKIYDYQKANWINIRKEISQNIDLNFQITNREQVENKLENFVKIIKDAVNKNIPIKNDKTQANSLPFYIRVLIRLKKIP